VGVARDDVDFDAFFRATFPAAHVLPIGSLARSRKRRMSRPTPSYVRLTVGVESASCPTEKRGSGESPPMQHSTGCADGERSRARRRKA